MQRARRAKHALRCLPIFCVLLLFCLLTAVRQLAAQEVPGTQQLREAEVRIAALDRKLDAGLPDANTLTGWQESLQNARSLALQCSEALAPQRQRLGANLGILPEPTAGEDRELTRTRTALLREKSELDRTETQCRLLAARVDELRDRIAGLQQALYTQRLTVRGLDFAALIRENWAQPELWMSSTLGFVTQHSGLEHLGTQQGSILAALVSIAVLGGVWLQRLLRTWLGRVRTAERFSAYFFRAALATLARYAPWLLITAAVAGFFGLRGVGMESWPFTTILALGLPVYFLLIAGIDLFLAPPAPAAHYLQLAPDVSYALARRLKVLLALVFAGYLLLATILSQALPEPAFLLVRAVFLAAFVINLIWVLWLLGRIPSLVGTKGFRSALALVLMAVVVAEALGYRNLSQFALLALFGSVALLGLARLISRLLEELFDGIEAGARGWQRTLRERLALKAGEPVPGLNWLRALSSVVLWGAFALALLKVWGLSDVGFAQISSYLFEGFAVGSLTVVPAKWLLALLILALLLTLNSWIKRRMAVHWLKHSRMQRGAKEALVTITGYAGTALAVMVGLAAAGMNFGNLAIMAGALSVGIGFGLQNIVNNFVSGLILLFERPVKTGDWIIVGNTQGYVKKISIRSTQIQTFDQADVIVPNSELIASQVTNWMLHDPRGRITVKVGVAYGTDTAKVRDLLLRIAHQHPLVVKDGSSPDPRVLFMSFGDSALQFELRCFVQFIDQGLVVQSDLNFAIEAAFRAHDISMPFPQREIRIHHETSERMPLPPPQVDRKGEGHAPDASADADGG